MSPQTDISGWPNIDQVMAQTGKSRRTLEREVKAGKWHTRQRARPGVRPEVVFHPDQVAARTPPPTSWVTKGVPVMMPPDTAMAETQEPGIPLDMITQVVTAVFERFAGVGQVAPAAQKLFVTLDEASELSGLSAGLLRKAAKEGKLTHALDADKSRHYTVVKIKRAALEAFEPE